jgi:anti-anti-sigma regulatory factor
LQRRSGVRNIAGMANALNWTVSHGPNETRVAFSGDIREDTEFDALLQAIAAPRVVLDLAEVRSINSLGVREWLKFVAALERKTSAFELVNCSVAVVQQLNSTANFRGAGRVRSIFAPYFCAQCDADRALHIELDGASDVRDDNPPCPKCRAPMEPSGLTVLLHLPSVNST